MNKSEIGTRVELAGLVPYTHRQTCVFPLYASRGKTSTRAAEFAAPSYAVAFVALRAEDFPSLEDMGIEDGLSGDGKMYRLTFEDRLDYDRTEVDAMLAKAKEALMQAKPAA